MVRFLVTGGAGFIGSALVRAVLERGDEVTVLDDLSTGRMSNLHPVEDQIRFVRGSLLEDEALGEALRGADYVLHQAAIPSVQRSFDEPLLTHRVNVEGTLRLLLAARDSDVRRVVMASSSAIYGDDPVLPKREDLPPAPISPYALHKYDCEVHAALFTRQLGLEVVCLRYFNVFGPRQDPASEYAAVIPKFITRMLRNEQPIIFGDGEQSRDFCFVGNVARANLLACEAPGAPGRTFNVATGSRMSLLELAAALEQVLDVRLRPRHEPIRPGDIRHSWADISLARQVLGYEPEVDFVAGLKQTVDWYRRSSG